VRQHLVLDDKFSTFFSFFLPPFFFSVSKLLAYRENSKFSKTEVAPKAPESVAPSSPPFLFFPPFFSSFVVQFTSDS